MVRWERGKSEGTDFRIIRAQTGYEESCLTFGEFDGLRDWQLYVFSLSNGCWGVFKVNH